MPLDSMKMGHSRSPSDVGRYGGNSWLNLAKFYPERAVVSALVSGWQAADPVCAGFLGLAITSRSTIPLAGCM
jgi:hypothetical protein